MKLKLIFPYPAWKEVSEKYFITIHRNKIHNYIGLHPLKKSIGFSEQEESEKFINSFYKIYKLDKLDRKELNTKATHEIVSQELHNAVQGHKYCLKLNWFQEFYINWFHKKYIIQSLDFKKSILTGFAGAIIGALVTLAFQTNQKTQNETNIPIKKEIKNQNEQKPIIKLTEFQDGRWISTTDSLSGIEIKNGKWMMFYKGTETDSTYIYDFKIKREYIKELGTEHKPFEFLTIMNKSDTLDYSILEYSNELLSLSYIPRGNTLNYKPEK
ncbi:hypothetical protein AWE51_25490 [Aquimarina aggregata]|uniref:Uncharacterized protein n=1 Tax=Aquimarina aggregata TaxID=1642818 RepID=A0A162ZWV1_9FLAO|nr:hypothetical protein [Aquimarina aggregata]KZS40092.1 hypothetical protein AWE51_25490 [Aquimarina aggregata]